MDFQEKLNAFSFISGETRMDLVFKERMRLLAKSRLMPEKGAQKFLPYDSKDDDALFDPGMNALQNECKDFFFQGVDVTGPVEMMDYHYMPHAMLKFSTISYLFYECIDEGDVVYDHEKDDVDDFLWDEDCDSEEEKEEAREKVREFLKAYELGKSGKVDEALSYPVYANFCRDMANEVYYGVGDACGVEAVAMNADYFMYPFNEGNEEYWARCGLYCSKEVYLYDKYRNSLSPSLRKQADGYVKVFNEPSGMCENIYFDCNGYRVVIYRVAQKMDRISGMEARTFNVLFSTAVEWLDKNLPAMREKFYAEDKDVSVKEDALSDAA